MRKSSFSPYNVKVIVSGDVVEIYDYENEQYKKCLEDVEVTEELETESDVKTATKLQSTPDVNYKRKDRTIARTKRNLKRLIESNVRQYEQQDKFISLDFAQYLNRDEVINCFRQFNKRLKYNYPKYDYQYIAIIERGGNGTQRLHLHCLFFGLPFINIYTFQKIWKYGNVDMESIKDGNVANYVLKYVEKTLEDGSYIPRGAKFYLSSKGLKKPEEMFMSYEQLEEFMKENHDKVMVYNNEYDSDYVGKFKYYKLYSSSQADERMTREKFELYQEFGDFIEDERQQKKELHDRLMLEYNIAPEDIIL